MKKLFFILCMLSATIGFSQTNKVDTVFVPQKVDTLQIIQNYLNSAQYIIVDSYTKPVKQEKYRDIFLGGGTGIMNFKTPGQAAELMYYVQGSAVAGKWQYGVQFGNNSLSGFVARSIK